MVFYVNSQEKESSSEIAFLLCILRLNSATFSEIQST